MGSIQKKLYWRLEKVNELLETENYEEAFKGYSELVRLFNRLDGYDDYERLEFYKKLKSSGDSLLFRLAKKKISNVIKKHKFLERNFKKRLGLTKDNFNKHICDLIKEERFEEVLRANETN